MRPRNGPVLHHLRTTVDAMTRHVGTRPRLYRANDQSAYDGAGPDVRGGNRRETSVSGEPAHFEIPADDTGQAQEFWGSLFGWKFESFPGPFEYHMTRIDDRTGIAITNMEPGKRGIRPYFYVDDIKAGAERVIELGGSADQPRPVPSMGWFAICSDPGGNQFGLWQNDEAAPPPE
jgi:uncharacterized protein